MKKGIIFILCLFFAVSVLAGCSQQSQNNQTEISNEEVEAVLESSLWQVNNQAVYLLFHGQTEVLQYDLSLLDEETEQIEKSLLFGIETNETYGKAVYFPNLLGKNSVRFQYQSETNTFVSLEDSFSVQQVSFKTFAEDFMQHIENAGKDKNWESQAEMNVAASVRCKYWDSLYQAANRHLKAILSEEEYNTFSTQTKAFETARQAAMDEAGKEVEGGSLYPVVTGGAYCTETKKEIESILTKYFS